MDRHGFGPYLCGARYGGEKADLHRYMSVSTAVSGQIYVLALLQLSGKGGRDGGGGLGGCWKMEGSCGG